MPAKLPSVMAKRRKYIIPAIIVAAFLPIWSHACLAGPGHVSVVTSVFPLYEFSRAVAGQSGDIHLLVPPGAEPHTWEPKPSDIALIRNADLFIFMGHEMEPWVSDILGSMGKNGPRVLEAAMGLTSTLEGSARDPHLWLDFSLSAEMVRHIEGALVSLDPASGAFYRKNATGYEEELKSMDGLFRTGLSGCKTRKFVFGGHSAFAYLAGRYGLEQIPLLGRIVKIVRENHLKVIYFEKLVNPRLAQVIADETGAGTMALYPAGNLTASQWKEGVTFLDLMKENLANLRQGLECE